MRYADIVDFGSAPVWISDDGNGAGLVAMFGRNANDTTAGERTENAAVGVKCPAKTVRKNHHGIFATGG